MLNIFRSHYTEQLNAIPAMPFTSALCEGQCQYWRCQKCSGLWRHLNSELIQHINILLVTFIQLSQIQYSIHVTGIAVSCRYYNIVLLNTKILKFLFFGSNSCLWTLKNIRELSIVFFLFDFVICWRTHQFVKCSIFIRKKSILKRTGRGQHVEIFSRTDNSRFLDRGEWKGDVVHIFFCSILSTQAHTRNYKLTVAQNHILFKR